MSRSTELPSELNQKSGVACPVGLDPLLSFATLPMLLAVVTIRQAERSLGQWGRLSESLLQGEQLPILDRRCSGVQNIAE